MSDSQPPSENHGSALTWWGLLGGILLGVIIGWVAGHLLGWTVCLGAAGYVTGALFDRSKP